MVFSSLAAGTTAHHGKYSSREGVGISRIIVHHWAGTAGGDARLLNPSETVSANYILYSDGTLLCQVPEEYRAWTSGSWEADAPSITIEIQNSGGPENGNDNTAGAWPITLAAYVKLVALIADLGRRYGWGVIDRSRVVGHREVALPSAPTACPGGYLWARLHHIANEANDQLNPPTPPAPAPPKPKGFLVDYISFWRNKTDAGTAGLKAIAKGEQKLPVGRQINLTLGPRDAILEGPCGVDMMLSVKLKGKAGTRVNLFTRRGAWKNGKWAETAYLDPVSVTLDAAGEAAVQLALKNRLGKGERAYVAVFTERGKPAVTVTRFSGKGWKL